MKRGTIMEYILDNFIININLSNDSLMSTVYFINKIVLGSSGTFHIIDFSNSNIENYFTIDDSKNEEFIDNTKNIVNKLLFVDNPPKSITWLKNYISDLGKSDFIFIIGAERLIDYKNINTVMEGQFFDTKTTHHLHKDENWKPFLDELDNIYGYYQERVQGIFTNINTDMLCQKLINDYLNDSENMSITSTTGVENNDINRYKFEESLIQQISKIPMNDAFKLLKKHKEELGSYTYMRYTAMIYYKSGDISKCVDILNDEYNSLHNEDKLFLADLLMLTKKSERANEILCELYREDKYLKNLFNSIIRLNKNNETIDFWIEEAKKYDPDNPAVIEAYASRLSSAEKYSEAAKEFRKLSEMLDDPYYELIARMNDILADKFDCDDDKIKSIKEYTDLYPNLHNEGCLRLARYFIHNNDSYFLGYKCLQSAFIEIGKPLVNEIVQMKLHILKDEKLAAKAMRKLKPFTKTSDAERIARERTQFIVDSVGVLASIQNGYLLWRDFLTCQNNYIWNKYIFIILKEKLKKLITVDIETEIDKSYIKYMYRQPVCELGDNIENNPRQLSVNLINLLRATKSGHFDISEFETYDDFLQAVLTPGEVFNDNMLKLLTRYYIAIIASLQGKHQDANNYALSIFDFYGVVNDKLKTLCLYLGLISWGYSQYRLGRKTEGILCITAAIDLCIDTNEVIPLLEDGLNIVSRFIYDEVSKQFESDLRDWEDIINFFKKYNENMLNLYLLFNKKSDDLKLSLQNRIERCKNQDIEWAGDIVNLISLYAKDKEIDKAQRLINNYSKSVISLMKKRKDIRFEILYNWALICFSNLKEINNIFYALNLIELASKDIEDKRKLSHREERASIGVQSRKIYKLYIDICFVILQIITNEDFKNNIQEKIENILQKLSPRSIIEQKNYYNENSLTDEAIKTEHEYKIKLEEYKNMLLEESSNIELLSHKAEEVERLKKELKEIHPYYMDLQSYSQLSISEIQNIINEKDILFQNILTTTGIVIVIISKNDIIIKHRITDEAKIRELSEEFSKCVQSPVIASQDLKKIVNDISNEIGRELFEYLENHTVDRIFNIPNFELNMVSIASLCIDGTYLIDTVDSIVNIIDYTSLILYKEKNMICGVINTVIGNPSDPNLAEIKRWLEKRANDSFLITDSIENLKELKKDIKDKSFFDTIVIYSHGVKSPTAEIIYGAKGIDGNKKIIRLDDEIDGIVNFKNLILISCSAGSPDTIQIEESNGTLSTILERFNGNLILCKWDVITNQTLTLLENLFIELQDEKINIDKALIIAQRCIKDQYKEYQYWAGIEFWVN